jgi:FkbM family methyltransferase
MKQCIFTNDDNVSIILIEHPFSDRFSTRNNHEIIFRKINTFLIKNNIIKNNIIDLGSWMGDNSIPWAKNINGIVYAIDPSPENCNFITEMSKINQIKNIKVIETAISSKDELLTTDDDLTHCSFVYNNPGQNGRNKLKAVSLDYLYDIKEIENIGYIHLDVEGMEFNVLQGSSNIIDICRPIISYEQHLEIDNCDIILSYLKNKHYTIFLIDEVLPGCRHDCRNSLAFPNELLKVNEDLITNINCYIEKNILLLK